jgi:hypothetical protein
LGYLYWKSFGSKIASANQEEVRIGKQAVEGSDPHAGHSTYVIEVLHCVGVRRVSYGMVEIKLLCFR